MMSLKLDLEDESYSAVQYNCNVIEALLEG